MLAWHAQGCWKFHACICTGARFKLTSAVNDTARVCEKLFNPREEFGPTGKQTIKDSHMQNTQATQASVSTALSRHSCVGPQHFRVTIVHHEHSTTNIGIEELQRLLNETPCGVVVVGSYSKFKYGPARNDIRCFVDGEYAFNGPVRIFPGIFRMEDVLVQDTVFARFYAASSSAVPNDEDLLCKTIRDNATVFGEPLLLPQQNLPEPRSELFRTVGVAVDRNIMSISSKELQDALAKYPACLVIPGSCDLFCSRFDEMDIQNVRNGMASACFMRSKVFPRTFMRREFVMGYRTFLHLGDLEIMDSPECVQEADVKSMVEFCFKNPGHGITITEKQQMQEMFDDNVLEEELGIPALKKMNCKTSCTETSSPSLIESSWDGASIVCPIRWLQRKP